MVLKIASHAATVVGQNKMDRVRDVWTGGRGQRRVTLFKVMSHTFGNTITD